MVGSEQDGDAARVGEGEREVQQRRGRRATTTTREGREGAIVVFSAAQLRCCALATAPLLVAPEVGACGALAAVRQ